MKRWDIINYLIKTGGYEDYLEVGVRDGGCFEKVVARNKTGVDPNPIHRAAYYCIKKTSDEFFKDNECKFDIVFIDGLHLNEQVEKDIYNAVDCLHDGGVVVCHDMNPLEKEHQVREYKPPMLWNGDCWKAWVRCRMSNPDWDMYVVDTDHGCGIIHPTREIVKAYKDLELHFDMLEQNREEMLNLISISQFFDKWL